MNKKDILAFLDADVEAAEEIVYPEFKPFFSKDGIINFRPIHRLFDDTPEQISHGIAPWDEYGWSRDGWGI